MVQTRTATAQTEERQREILRAASVVFRRQGLYGTGMREIASELGVAVGKLYYYFQSKEELLAFCQTDCLNRLGRSLSAILALSLDVPRKLALLIAEHVRCLNEESQGSLAHLEVESLEEPARTSILRLRRRYEDGLRRLIESGVDEGTLRVESSKLSALAILGAVNWTVKWFREDGPQTTDEVGDAFASQLVRGLMVHPEQFAMPPRTLLSPSSKAAHDAS